MKPTWNKPGIPHKGWLYVRIEDIEEPTFKCEMCGNEYIRFVHFLSHRDYEKEIKVGCICASKMTGDYEYPKIKEKHLKSIISKRSRWLTRVWRVSKSGNEYLNIGGKNIGIWVDRTHNPTPAIRTRIEGEFFKERFQDEKEAKMFLFDKLYQHDKEKHHEKV